MLHFIYLYAECHRAECRYAECRYAECRGAIIYTVDFRVRFWRAFLQPTAAL